ncbi:hypothetical protein Tco_0348520 [Tanacetum coccineum]
MVISSPSYKKHIELVLNSPCFMVKSWLVEDQTVLGKDYSNLLIVDSLLKTIWFINAPCYGNKALASPKANELTIPEQTATGKGISNLFMADDHKDKECSQEVLGYNPQKINKKKLEVNKSTKANQNAGTQDNIDAGDSEIEAESTQDYFVLPIWSSYTSTIKSSKANNTGKKQMLTDAAKALRKEFAQETKDLLLQAGAAKANSTNILNIVSTPVSTASPYGGLSCTDLTNTDQDDSEIPTLEKIYDNPTNGIFTNSSYDDEGAVADFTNLEPVMNVSPIPTSRINSIHPSTQILGDPQSAVQTRSKVTKSSGAHAFKFSEALDDESWVDVMQEELLQFKIQKVWILVDLPYRKKVIGTKWVYRNKKDERGVVVRNKARYLKGKPKLGLWYPRVSSFHLEAYSDSDYAGANLDRKSTTGGCQFLGRRLISWQCKKQTIVATSTTETEYVSAINCCGQVLWIQNQMLDYGFNFMSTKIYIDNKSTICIVKNLVFHSKTKHIAIGHHFIRDAYEKKLIQLKSVPVPLDHFPVNALTKDREFWWNHRVIDQAKKFNNRKATKQIKKLKKKAKPVITHHRAWMKSVSLKQGLAGNKS